MLEPPPLFDAAHDKSNNSQWFFFSPYLAVMMNPCIHFFPLFPNFLVCAARQKPSCFAGPSRFEPGNTFRRACIVHSWQRIDDKASLLTRPSLFIDKQLPVVVYIRHWALGRHGVTGPSCKYIGHILELNRVVVSGHILKIITLSLH